MKKLILFILFFAFALNADAAKMSSYTDNTTPNADVYFIGVDPNDTSQTVNGSNYRYSLNSVLGLGLLDAVFNSLSVTGTGDSWIELENNTSFTDDLTGKYGLRFYNGALQKIINGTASAITSGGVTITEGTDTADPSTMSEGDIYVETDTGNTTIKTALGSVEIAGTYTADPTAPVLSSATLGTNGTTLTLVFDQAVSHGSGYTLDDFNVDASVTGNDIAMTYTSGDTTDTHVMELASTVNAGETVDFDFLGTANCMENGTGDDLAAIVSASVTNNSTQGAGLTVNDTFTGDENPLATNWTTVTATSYNAMRKTGGSAIGVGAEWNAAYWDADTPADNQYAKITLSGSPSYHGVVLRDNVDGFYTAYASSHGNRVYVQRLDKSGMVYTSLVDGAAYSTTTVPSGATLELRISGSTLTCLVNDTPINGTLLTDATYSSGNFGIITYGTVDGITTFDAGDL